MYFKTWEVRSPELQTVLDLELKRRSYGRLKMSAQTMSGNDAAAPTLDTFWSSYWSSNYSYYILFLSLGIQESNSLNGVQIGVETKKLWPFEDDCANNELKCRSRTPFRNCWTHFGALHGAQIMYTICRFESWEVRSPALQTVHDLDLKRRSYGILKMNRAKPNRKFFDFAVAPPFRRVFRNCETTLWHTSAILHLHPLIS